MGGAARRGVFTSLALLGLVAGYPTAAHATASTDRTAARNGGPASEDGIAVREAAARRPPASAVMPLAGRRLPPPGYLDYCLRFRGRDEACAW